MLLLAELLVIYVQIEMSLSYFKLAEEKRNDKHKFQTCFDNIGDSIIILSNGKIEYANDSFLVKFSCYIENFQYCK